VECPALVAGLRILPKAFFWRDGADLAKHFARTSVPDWFLWSLVLIGLMLAALVTLVLRFLKNDESRDGNGDG
jgi:hypothetical protein